MSKSDNDNIEYDDFTEEERNILNMSAEAMSRNNYIAKELYPFFINSIGFKKNENGDLEKMSSEEFKNILDEPARKAFENQIILQERQMEALRGERPIASGLQKEMDDDRNKYEENLARQYGSNWKNTTFGQKAIQDFDLNQNIRKDTALRNDLIGLSGINYYNPMQFQNDIKYYSGIIPNSPESYQLALAPYAQQRANAFQARKLSLENKRESEQGFGQAIGTIAGGGVGYYLGGVKGAQTGASIGGKAGGGLS